ncbi:MAG: hypothetical protein JJ693_05920 [Acidithiobacillus sp.]|nr:hypothetical protein [Acidithiobacillus sp.]
MGISTSLSIIAICAILALLILAGVAGVVVRTFLRLERVLARVEQDMAPVVLDLKLVLSELQRIVRSGSKQMDRVDGTLRYLDREIRDSVDTLVIPIRELALWVRAVRRGWRYFSRRR